jgi:O-acetyl-ADP-ribose deacetylase (regulator of RNase III)
MKIKDIQELYYITSVEHVPSILEKGILSHNSAHSQNLVKEDFSMSNVQDIRAKKIVPISGDQKSIHHHVNLYFQPKNPTLFVKKNMETLLILRIRPEVLQRDDAVVSTMNAAVRDAEFYHAIEGVEKLREEHLFSDTWQASDPETTKRNGQLRSAELLIPDRLHPSYIGGVFVRSSGQKEIVECKLKGKSPIPIDVHPKIFFGQDDTIRTISALANSNFEKIQNFPSLLPAQNKIQPRKAVPLAQNQKTLTTFFQKGGEVAIPQHLPSIKKIPSNIKLVKGSLFESKCKTLVNTVNCVGVMGKGIALEFKKQYPSLFKEYKDLCNQNQVKLGEPYLYRDTQGNSIINFPTKSHWKNDGDIEAIKTGLNVLIAKANEWELISVAIPPLGCGNGNLLWKDIGPIMVKTLANAPFQVEIYVPSKTTKNQISASFLIK